MSEPVRFIDVLAGVLPLAVCLGAPVIVSTALFLIIGG